MRFGGLAGCSGLVLAKTALSTGSPTAAAAAAATAAATRTPTPTEPGPESPLPERTPDSTAVQSQNTVSRIFDQNDF